MSGIAHILLKRGVKVSGSDTYASRITEELEKSGARVFIGHDAGQVNGSDMVVYSSAIKEDNPEYRRAKETGVTLIKRAQALAELMEDKTVIAVSGSHGKTTTSSLASLLLIEAGLKPTIAVGGILKNIGANAYFGDGDYFVAEADESDGSFLYYKPTYSIITNIDREHLDYYGDFDTEVKAFKKFIESTNDNGCVFYCADDPVLTRIANDSNKRKVKFGLSNSADIYPDNIKVGQFRSEFDVFYKSQFIERFCLSLAGMHNISNALSVIALGLELEIDIPYIKDTLLKYKGSGRRLEVKLKNNDLTVVDDYAHHPTEIKASLEALRGLGVGRILVIFQPHRYTRTKLLLDDFAKSFTMADQLVVTDIYPAGELLIEGVSAQLLVERINKFSSSKEAVYLPKEKIAEYILRIIQPGDLIVTLGAGDITRISDELAKRITE